MQPVKTITNFIPLTLAIFHLHSFEQIEAAPMASRGEGPRNQSVFHMPAFSDGIVSNLFSSICAAEPDAPLQIENIRELGKLYFSTINPNQEALIAIQRLYELMKSTPNLFDIQSIFAVKEFLATDQDPMLKAELLAVLQSASTASANQSTPNERQVTGSLMLLKYYEDPECKAAVRKAAETKLVRQGIIRD